MDRPNREAREAAPLRSLPLLLAALLLLAVPAARAQEQPVQVPPDIPEPERSELLARRGTLVVRGRLLASDVAAHNGKCGSVPAGSPLEAECRSEIGRLRERISAYEADVRVFNAAVKEAKTTPAAALDCATAEAFADAEALGPAGRDLIRGLRAELAGVLAGLRDKPPSGKAGAVTSISVSRDSASEGAAGGTQLIIAVLITRDEATGEVRLDVQSSIRPPGGPERASQNLVAVGRDGRIRDHSASPSATDCLDGLAK